MKPSQLKSLLWRWNDAAALETMLERRQDFSERYGVDFFFKREDRIDDLGSGHKRRRLQYLRGALLREGVDVLITAGSLPSGQCVAVSAAARAWGLRSRLIYLGDLQARPDEPAGNYLNATLLASRTDWFERTAWDQVDTILNRVAEEERLSGAIPMVIAPGIPTWPAPLGSVELGLQIFEQLQALPDPERQIHILALAGTGGTCAGLIAASEVLGADWIIHGICMRAQSESARATLNSAIAICERWLEIDLSGVFNFRLHSFPWSGAYACPSAFELEGMMRLIRDNQLPLDPNYMIKVVLGFEELVASGEIKRGDRVVVVYSGGSGDFVAGTPLARDWLSSH